MGFEVWIIIVLAASGLSGWIGYAYARKDAPKQSDLDDLAAELDEARQQAESVQTNVSEHFEQSALLFGKLAADYREFLDHFSASAQNLGLSEARARELIEQGFQPLLTHEAIDDAVVVEAEQAPAAEPASAAAEQTAEEPETAVEEAPVTVSDVTVEMPGEAGERADDEIQAEAGKVADAAAEEVAEAEAEEAIRQDALMEAADDARRSRSA